MRLIAQLASLRAAAACGTMIMVTLAVIAITNADETSVRGRREGGGDLGLIDFICAIILAGMRRRY